MTAVVLAQAPGTPQTVLTMPPTPLLPQHASSLAITSPATETPAAQLGSVTFAGPGCVPGGTGACPFDAAAILKEDGLIRAASGHYADAVGGAAVEAFAMEFGDATGAYSAYTFYRSLARSQRITSGDARLGKVAGETTLVADGAVLWAGTAVLRVNGRISAAQLDALKFALPKVGGRRGLAPLLPTYLPIKGAEAATARYALGPLGYKAMNGVLPADMLSWDKSAETLTSDYAADASANGGKGVLTLLLYPTPQIAGDRGRAIEKIMTEGGPARFGTVKLRRIGPLLGLTSGGFTPEHAEALVHTLHLTQDLTYDKPMPLEFHTEVRKTATLLQEIAIFCGLGILASVVIGAFLGGARAGIRVLRGKPAASEPEFLSINLRDQPKRLFAAPIPATAPDDNRVHQDQGV